MLQVGATFQGRYKILEVLGSGGMGTVFKARQLDADRIIALKILHGIDPSDKNVKRFQREAKMLAQLQHLNIVNVYHFGLTNDGFPYAALEYLSGRDLKSLMDEFAPQRIPLERLIKIMKQVCQGLSHSHKHGIVHRDMKPENIFIVNEPEPDSVKIVDFGLGRFVEGQESKKLTQTGFAVGTILYMSPEQCLGQPAEAGSDVYACGCILYELCTGKTPFDAESTVDLLYKHIKEPTPPFPNQESQNNQLLSLEAICQKALQKDPAARYQNMEEFFKDLELVDSGELAGLVARTPVGKRRQSKILYFVTAILGAMLLFAPAIWKSLALNQVGVKDFKASIKAPSRASPEKMKAGQSAAEALAGVDEVYTEAETYRNQGKCAEAEPLYKRIVLVRESYDPESTATAMAMYGMGLNYKRQKKYIMAEEWLEKSLKILEKNYGKDSLGITENLFYLAQLFHHEKKYEKAEEYYKRALAIRSKIFGPDSAEVKWVKDALGALLVEMKTATK